MSNGLTKEHSKMLYGVAIVLMVVHHLFCLPQRLNCEYYSILGNGIVEKIAWFCKICVAIYAFISGYAIYKKCHYKEGEKFNFFTRLGNYYLTALKQLLGFLTRYWIVFAIFIPLGFALKKLPDFSWDVFWESLKGFSSAYNGEWWYVKFYITVIAYSPLICFCCDLLRKSFTKRSQIFALILIAIAGYYFCRWMSIRYEIDEKYYRIFLIGYLVASFKVFEYMSVFEKKKALNVILCCLILVCVIALRVKVADKPDYCKIDQVIIVPFICLV